MYLFVRHVTRLCVLDLESLKSAESVMVLGLDQRKREENQYKITDFLNYFLKKIIPL